MARWASEAEVQHIEAEQGSRENFHLMTAKIAYVTGGLDIEEFEASVWHVLNGGTLTSEGRPYHSPFPEPQMEMVKS
jgi:hypothetical protein